MPSLKAPATAACKTPFVRIPRIAPPLKTRMNKKNVYLGWLEGLLRAPQNKKAFLRCEKEIVD